MQARTLVVACLRFRIGDSQRFSEIKSMPRPNSDDLREGVIEGVVAGASRREAAESFSLSASSAVRWLQRWRDTGSARAKLSDGSMSPLEEQEWLLALVAKQLLG